MPDDDGGFYRRETRGDGIAAPYFECVKREEACEDMGLAAVKACGCNDCVAFLAYREEMDEANAEADMMDAR